MGKEEGKGEKKTFDLSGEKGLEINSHIFQCPCETYSSANKKLLVGMLAGDMTQAKENEVEALNVQRAVGPNNC